MLVYMYSEDSVEQSLNILFLALNMLSLFSFILLLYMLSYGVVCMLGLVNILCSNSSNVIYVIIVFEIIVAST